MSPPEDFDRFSALVKDWWQPVSYALGGFALAIGVIGRGVRNWISRHVDLSNARFKNIEDDVECLKSGVEKRDRTLVESTHAQALKEQRVDLILQDHERRHAEVMMRLEKGFGDINKGLTDVIARLAEAVTK